MARGSFNGLYTFQDVANIYGIAQLLDSKYNVVSFVIMRLKSLGKLGLLLNKL